MTNGLLWSARRGVRRLLRRPVTLNDLFPAKALQRAISDEHVRVRHHPDLPYDIYNYTDLCMFSRAWTLVTKTCRGLIVHRETGRVIARPFKKFYGTDDPIGEAVDFNEPVTVTDKMDGALGVCYPVGDGEFAIATRGSFESVPALHATKVWQERYAGRWSPPPGMTALFEIVYPGWRIVLDYGDLDDLVLLGFVDIRTGRSFSPTDTRGWPGPVAEVFPYRSYLEALAAPLRDNAEGFVVHFLKSDVRKKWKYDAYLAMHRIMFGLTARRLWTHLAAQACKDHIHEQKHWASLLRLDPAEARQVLAVGANWLNDIIEAAPDECYGWIRDRVAELEQAAEARLSEICRQFMTYTAEAGGDRRRFWELTRHEPNQKALLMRWDGYAIEPWVWKQIRPAHETPFMAAIGQDVA